MYVKIRLTAELLLKGSSRNGGWSREQLEILGVHWPLKKGWKDRIVGDDYAQEVIDRFLAMKDRHLKQEENDLFSGVR